MRLISLSKMVIAALVFCFVVGFGRAGGGSGKTYGAIHNVKYVKSYDGKTFIFNIPGVHPLLGDRIDVRLRGIEVPEIAGRCEQEKKLAEQSRDIVDWLMKKARMITLENVGRDKLFRIVATVLVDGKDVRRILIAKGLAVRPQDRRQKNNWCD